MRNIAKLLALAGTIIGISLTAAAAEYVSLNGQFRFTYPDDWEQMDYNTVDAFLAKNRASRESFAYEAVFSPKTNSPFYDGNYLILTVSLVGALDSTQTDSAMNALGRVFGNKVRYYPQSDYIANLNSNTPYFDRKNRVAKIINDLSEGSDPFKKNLLVIKFYDQGMARFYFYSPDSLFDSSRPLFEQMVSSFSTDSLEQSLPKEDVKIADIDTDEEKSNKGSWVAIYSVFIVLIIIIVTRRKKRRAAKSE